MPVDRLVRFTLGGMRFEYDEGKNRKNVQKHGISFKSAARVFFDYDRIEMFDEEHSYDEEWFDTIGDISAGYASVGDIEINQRSSTIGNLNQSIGKVNDILFVVYTERVIQEDDERESEVTRLISARLATAFERGLYQMCRKTPCFSYGDIRHVHRIYAGN